MSGFDPAQDAPDRAAPDFDAAAEQLFAETDAPQDAPAAAQPRRPRPPRTSPTTTTRRCR
jgi:hypothetical protein